MVGGAAEGVSRIGAPTAEGPPLRTGLFLDAPVGYYALRHESEYAEAHLFLALWHGVGLLAEQEPAQRELYWDLYLDWLTDALDMSYREVVSKFSTDSIWEVMFLSGPVITDEVLREQINGDCGSATVAHLHTCVSWRPVRNG